MGLDMYLYAEKHISPYDYETNNDGKMSRRDNEDFNKVIESAGMKGLPTGEYGSVTVSKCVAYWRKANAVHGWIVRNLAEDVDECQRIYMSREDLINLRNVCVGALTDRHLATATNPDNFSKKLDGNDDNTNVVNIMNAIKQEVERAKVTGTTATDSDPIPPTSGFFFGSNEKDEWYYEYLADTVETINSILASDTEGEYSYIYQASW